MNARVLTMLVVLTLVAGYVDAVAFFGLGVFTANMTGNTVLLGGAIAARFVPALPGSIGLLLPALSVAAFVGAAVAAAGILRGEAGRPPLRSRGVLVAVAVLLAVAAAVQLEASRISFAGPLVVGLLSAVMGLQSVVATRAGVAGISTTFVTGTLVRAVIDFAGTPAPQPSLRAEGRSNVAVWACYLAGAVGGSLALSDLRAHALWIPAAVVALLLPVL